MKIKDITSEDRERTDEFAQFLLPVLRRAAISTGARVAASRALGEPKTESASETEQEVGGIGSFVDGLLDGPGDTDDMMYQENYLADMSENVNEGFLGSIKGAIKGIAKAKPLTGTDVPYELRNLDTAGTGETIATGFLRGLTGKDNLELNPWRKERDDRLEEINRERKRQGKPPLKYDPKTNKLVPVLPTGTAPATSGTTPPATSGTTTSPLIILPSRARRVTEGKPPTRLVEGGNEFKDQTKKPVTKQNASTEDVQSAVADLGQQIGVDLTKSLTGSAIYPGAETGDADTILDPEDFGLSGEDSKQVQNQLRDLLRSKLGQAGYTEIPKSATVDAAGRFFKVSGDGLTVCVQIPGRQEWLQIDLDIAEPGSGKFSKWSKRGEPNVPGTPKESRAKGAYRHILKNEIARAIDPDWMWSFKHGLVSRTTGAAAVPGSDPRDPDMISRALFDDQATAADLDNISTILAKFKQVHPDKYQDVIDRANAGLEKFKTQYRMVETARRLKEEAKKLKTESRLLREYKEFQKS